MEAEIKNYPKSAETFQVVHLNENNKVILKSKEFETISEAKDFANETKTALGIGKIKWRILWIQKSLFDLSSSSKLLK